MENQEIKALTPTTCPHCKKDIIVEVITTAPRLTSILTIQDIEDAKQNALRLIDEYGFTIEQSKETIDWINNPETVFGPSDVENIIKGISGNIE